MLADSTVLANSEDPVAATAATTGVNEGGGGGASNSGEELDKNMMIRVDEGEMMNSYGGNRWPRQETLALLKIRSDMDTVFRDSSPKAPLWEQVSRRLAELGYNRSAKKCKEKFENVYKYHKRTKDGRTGKSEGKTYRFFDQLEAFDHHSTSQSTLPPPPIPPRPQSQPPPPPPPPNKTQTPITTTPTSTSLPWTNPPNNNMSHVTTVLSTTTTTTNPINAMPPSSVTPPPTTTAANPINPTPINILPYNSFQSISTQLFSSSTSSSTASDEEFVEGSRKRKRKWKDFFHRLTRDVLKKQEELQRRFLEKVEKHEHERMAREEAWRLKEMARITREHEILIQERSAAAAKDAAIIALLQKISGNGQQDNNSNTNIIQPQQPPQPQPPPAPPQQARQPSSASLAQVSNPSIPKRDDGENVNVGAASSRWPKPEVHALINLRRNLDLKYQENGPKGPLWEEISSEMRKLGYNRTAKRCKEKWENINKYFKKVKESNKKRPEASKTCPYFNQLDAIYKEKCKNETSLKPISTMEPLMVRPEQQWPPLPAPSSPPPETVAMKANERDDRSNSVFNVEEGGFGEDDEDEEELETEEEEEEDDDKGGGGGFEVAASSDKQASVGNGE